MSLYGALFAGVSGLQSQSSAMGAIADNVTNVNTIGYKGTNVNFKTLVTKQVSTTKYSPGGVQSAPRKGVDVQGLLQATTSSTDMGISGSGFFVVSEQAANSSGFGYTRAGSFKVDKDGYLQNVSGYYLQGWPLENWDGTQTAATVTKDGNVYMKSYKNTTGDTYYMNDNAVDSTNLQPLNLRTIGGTARATSTMAIGANLPGATGVTVGTTAKTNAQVFDSLGNNHNLDFTWVKRGTNRWDFLVMPPAGSTNIAVRDQSSSRNVAYSAGRMDFTSMPAAGTSLNMNIGGTSYNFNFKTSPTSTGLLDDGTQVNQVTRSATPLYADGDTITIGGVTFELDVGGGGVGAGNVAVTANTGDSLQTIRNNLVSAINANGVATAAADGSADFTISGSTITAGTGAFADFASTTSGKVGRTSSITVGGVVFNLVTGTATSDTDIDISSASDDSSLMGFLSEGVESYFDGKYGAGNWARQNGTDMNSSLVVTGGSGYLTPNGHNNVDNAGTTNEFDIDLTGKSLSQVLNQLSEMVNTAMAKEMNGTGTPFPPTPPGNIASRVEGENAIWFRQTDTSYDITVNATSVTNSNGDLAIMQGDSVYSIDRLSNNIAWTRSNATDNHGITFNGDGSIDKIFGMDETDATDPRLQITLGWANGAENMEGDSAISLFLGNYNSKDGMQQSGGNYQLNYFSQNGNKFGNFAGVSIGEDGIVTALFDNGVTTPIFMIPIATFVNPNGMNSASGNIFQETDSSGLPTIREAGTAGSGAIAGSALENSTVDLGEEFTSMITTQRAYSAASKIITTSDEMLDELIRIKR